MHKARKEFRPRKRAPKHENQYDRNHGRNGIRRNRAFVAKRHCLKRSIVRFWRQHPFDGRPDEAAKQDQQDIPNDIGGGTQKGGQDGV